MKPYYEDGLVTIYHGDCRAVLPLLPDVDLVVTDPPYGIGVGGRDGTIGGSNLGVAREYGEAVWDKRPPPRWLFDWLSEKARWLIVWGGNYFGLPPSSCWLVWDKDNSGNFADCELAWTNIPKAVRRFTWRWNGMLQEPGSPRETREYATQKPVPLMRWAISQAPASTTVLDPFMGSGSTLVAAKSMGKRAIGIDLSERACEIAARRCSQEVLGLSA